MNELTAEAFYDELEKISAAEKEAGFLDAVKRKAAPLALAGSLAGGTAGAPARAMAARTPSPYEYMEHVSARHLNEQMHENGAPRTLLKAHPVSTAKKLNVAFPPRTAEGLAYEAKHSKTL